MPPTTSWPSSSRDPAQPLFNRAVQALYVPGSIFKTVTATAALDTNLVDLNQPFMCTTAVKVGTYSVDCKNSQHIPRLTYKQAYAWSSNRVFGLTGMLLGFPRLAPINPWLDDHPPGDYPWARTGASIQPSADVLDDYARRFGFERSIPFDLPVATSHDQATRPPSGRPSCWCRPPSARASCR